jgi:hypothetical protein
LATPIKALIALTHQSKKMKNEHLESLMAPPFLREIHHLLWMKPFKKKGKRDPGWNCRDHAFLVELIVKMLGYECRTVQGRGEYLQGPQGIWSEPWLLYADPHRWVDIDGSGVMDLSPRLDHSQNETWLPWSPTYVIQSRCVPNGEFNVVHSQQELNGLQELVRGSPGMRRIAYLAKELIPLTRDRFLDAFRTTNSPLSIDLMKRYPASIYAHAAKHLYQFLQGTASSLSSTSQAEAWRYLASHSGDTLDWVIERARLG